LKAALAEMEQAAGSAPDWRHMIDGERQFAERMIDDAMDAPGGLWTMWNMDIGDSPKQIEPNGWSKLAQRLQRLYLPDRTIKKQLRRHFDTFADAGKVR
jgi:hypothetical protein